MRKNPEKLKSRPLVHRISRGALDTLVVTQYRYVTWYRHVTQFRHYIYLASGRRRSRRRSGQEQGQEPSSSVREISVRKYIFQKLAHYSFWNIYRTLLANVKFYNYWQIFGQFLATCTLCTCKLCRIPMATPRRHSTYRRVTYSVGTAQNVSHLEFVHGHSTVGYTAPNADRWNFDAKTPVF